MSLTIIGKVTTCQGVVTAENIKGRIRILRTDEPIYLNDLILTGDETSCQIVLTNGKPITFDHNIRLLINDTFLSAYDAPIKEDNLVIEDDQGPIVMPDPQSPDAVLSIPNESQLFQFEPTIQKQHVESNDLLFESAYQKMHPAIDPQISQPFDEYSDVPFLISPIPLSPSVNIDSINHDYPDTFHSVDYTLFVQDYEFTVNEHESINTIIAQIPMNNSLNVTFKGLDPGAVNITQDGIVFIENSNLLDYEHFSKLTLPVDIFDGKRHATFNITVNLNNINDLAPTIDSHPFVVYENSSPLTTVGIISGHDPDGDSLTYQMNSIDNIPFSVNSESGEIFVSENGMLDYEQQTTFQLDLIVSDGIHQTPSHVLIQIANENDNPPILAENQQFVIDENSPEGTIIGKPTIFDADGDILTYQIVQGYSDDVFGITSDGYLQVIKNNALDFETQSSYTIKVSASDNLHKSESDMMIMIQNLNDNKPQWTALTYDVDENLPENEPIQLWVTDADNDTLTFTLDTPNDFFELAPEGKLFLKQGSEIDYETIHQIDLTVSVSDGLHAVAQPISLQVQNLNDNAPTISFNSPVLWLIDEHIPNGTIVGTISAFDEDNDTLTYSITNNEKEPIFTITDQGVVCVAHSQALDFEQFNLYNLDITISDDVHETHAQATIFLNNINDNAPQIENQSFSVSELSDSGYCIGQVIAYDADQSDYSFHILEGNMDSLFAIDETNGNLYVNHNELIDYETSPSHQLTVEVSDGIFQDTAEIAISVENMDDMPHIIYDQFFSIDENSPMDTLIGSIHVDDPDNLPLSYHILSGNIDTPFSLDINTGELRIKNPDVLNFDHIQDYILSIEVSSENYVDVATCIIQLKEQVESKNNQLSIDNHETNPLSQIHSLSNGIAIETSRSNEHSTQLSEVAPFPMSNMDTLDHTVHHDMDFGYVNVMDYDSSLINDMALDSCSFVDLSPII